MNRLRKFVLFRRCFGRLGRARRDHKDVGDTLYAHYNIILAYAYIRNIVYVQNSPYSRINKNCQFPRNLSVIYLYKLTTTHTHNWFIVVCQLQSSRSICWKWHQLIFPDTMTSRPAEVSAVNVWWCGTIRNIIFYCVRVIIIFTANKRLCTLVEQNTRKKKTISPSVLHYIEYVLRFGGKNKNNVLCRRTVLITHGCKCIIRQKA